MASFGGPLTSGDRPATEPVPWPPSRWPTLALVVLLVGVSFLVGFRLGGDGASPPVVVPSNESPGSTLSTPPPPPVQPDAVSDELASTAGGLVPRYGWAICVVDIAPIVCQSIRAAAEPIDAFAGTAGPLSSPSARLAALWRVVPTSDVVGSHLVLVAELTLQMQPALLARVDGRQVNPEAMPVEPGRQGITYFDLGALTPGQYLVALVDQSASPPPASAAVLAQVVGLLVCASVPATGSPGCSFAP